MNPMISRLKTQHSYFSVESQINDAYSSESLMFSKEKNRSKRNYKIKRHPTSSYSFLSQKSSGDYTDYPNECMLVCGVTQGHNMLLKSSTFTNKSSM